MPGIVDLAVSGIAMALLARIAWIDFQTLRIANRDVLVLIGTVAVLVVPGVTPYGWANLLPGVILFALGVLFWLLRSMGAGDAKLFFPLGILIGWQGIATFALCLLPFSLLFLGLAKLGAAGRLGQGGLATRLATIGRGRGIPYGVPMAFSAIAATLWRLSL
ncbi:hypothetical protein HYN69_14310 [Gemmobacter aquarius]|uniref:Prepilin type IV endopeptidase peptidase domain-containing protein n=1 Tax=Paragemmobacter aquarius TaxID=2169400 RepID=A0A2S0UNX2_9RHOB|nr:prepilin peptidase [Gemmobacter aquarius]AWB49516.1 hypothetical protein HYN69_14310 [Gemmobacter aquarius]